MNYWQNTSEKVDKTIEWKSKCLDFFKEEENIDFFILQEINPIKLFEKTHNQYEFSMTDYSILYHELTNELLFDGRKSNCWGNAILFNKKYKLAKNNLENNDLYDIDKYYYGRNSIMCYDFVSPDNKAITIVNFYNKINYADKGQYTMLDDFENDSDIQSVLKHTSNNIILTGDFNTGFGPNDREQYGKFIENINKSLNLTDSVNNYSEKFIPTYCHLNGQFYLNDFCLTSKFDNVKIINEVDKWEYVDQRRLWKGLSDHRPLIIELE